MSGSVGGYLFFEPAQLRENLIESVLQAMELAAKDLAIMLTDEDGFPRYSYEGNPIQFDDPLENSLKTLAREESGVIKTDSGESFWLEPRVGPYPVLNIWVVDTAMFYKERPEYNETFVEHWLRLCEQGKAVFGYFSPFEHMFERGYAVERVLPWLQNGNLTKLLEVSDCYWVVYLGPELATKWREQQMPLPANVKPLLSRELSSGAHFLRITTSAYGY